MSLLTPFLCLLLFGTIDAGRLIQAQSRVNSAAHQAMRYAQNVINDSGNTPVTVNAITSTVQSNYPGVVVTISPSTISSNEVVVITASAPFSMVTPFVRNMVNQTNLTQVVTSTTLP